MVRLPEAAPDSGSAPAADGVSVSHRPIATRDRRARATLAYFRELCDEPLASQAAAEALVLYTIDAWRFSVRDAQAADEWLLEIARSTAARYGVDVDGELGDGDREQRPPPEIDHP